MKQIKHMILLCLLCLTGMAAQAQGPADNKIWYTATAKLAEVNGTGTEYGLHIDVFADAGGSPVSMLSHEWNEETGKGVITFDGDIATVGENAFYYCVDLSSVTFSANVTSIGKNAFYYCYNITNKTGLETVTFAEGSILETIEESAFYYCKFLSSITIPASVTSIGKQAFNQCSKLATVTFAEGSKLGTIGQQAFSGCSALSSITIPASVTSIGQQAFMSCSVLSSITIPASVTSIGKQAFTGCTKMETVTFAEGSKLETIGQLAFQSCSALSSIIIPASVTSMGNGAFQGCYDRNGTGLTTVTFAEGSKLEAIGDEAFRSCSALSSITIPASVTSIGNSAFNSCYDSRNRIGLTTVTFAEGSQLETIGESAFEACRVLSSVTIPASVTEIGKNAFYNCYDGSTGLTEVTFAEGSKLETIGESAFNGCGISSVTIPASVTEIGQKAFAYCKNLKSVTVNWTAADKIVQINSNVFSNCSEGWTLIVPDGTESLYIADSSWGPYTANMKVYIPVTLRRGLDSSDNYIGYFATFYSSESAYDLTGTNTKAYTGVLEDIEDDDEVKVLKLKDAGNIIGQGMGVVLKYAGEDQGSETIDIVLMPSEETATAGENILTGTDVELSWEDIPDNSYALSTSKEYGLGFYYCNYEGWTIGAHKAFLTLGDLYYSKAFILRFDDGETTSIQNSALIIQNSENDAMYDLNGVRVNDDYKGIVIKNGKKFYQK